MTERISVVRRRDAAAQALAQAESSEADEPKTDPALKVEASYADLKRRRRHKPVAIAAVLTAAATLVGSALTGAAAMMRSLRSGDAIEQRTTKLENQVQGISRKQADASLDIRELYRAIIDRRFRSRRFEQPAPAPSTAAAAVDAGQ